MNCPAVAIENLDLHYGRGKRKTSALKNLSTTFPYGSISGLLGPDAAGKSSLLRVLAGLLRPDAGKTLTFGKSPTELIGQIGYMPQKAGVYDDLTVGANLNLQIRLHGLAAENGHARAEQLLEFTGLAPFLNRLAGRLSGGMRQKLGIACALMGSPRLLLLDEPGVGVDPVSRRELWNMVQKLKDGGMTVIWATSYLDEARRFPHILLLDNGSSLFQGNPADLIKQADGRVFLLKENIRGQDAGKAHRESLSKWSMNQYVDDAIVQGDALRLALSPDAPEDLYAQIKKAGAKTAEPGFEDAYMSLLGGINHAPSPFSTLFQPHSADISRPMIEAINLTKKFGDFTAAKNISLSVRPGQVFGLLGPNGAGKSTTFLMLCGLLRPSSGQCFVAGINLLTSSGSARARLGYMSQKFSLYPDIKVAENIKCFGELYGMSASRLEKAKSGLGAAFGLSDFMEMKTADLPVGMKQRLSLLCATMHDPAVLFLDEPSSGVDARTRREFWKNITALTSLGTAILVTTHFMEEAEYCDEIALLYKGAIIRQGSPDSLKKSVGNMENPTLEDAFIDSIKSYNERHPAG